MADKISSAFITWRDVGAIKYSTLTLFHVDIGGTSMNYEGMNNEEVICFCVARSKRSRLLSK